MIGHLRARSAKLNGYLILRVRPIWAPFFGVTI